MTNNKIICNKCGRNILVESGIPKEDFININKNWGYFSKKDGKNYKIIICEECADNLVEQFIVPVQISDITEML